MNISHTPGPWQVSEIFEGHIYSNGLLIGEANNQLIHRHANARLMAAAPKLLEACKASLKEFQNVLALVAPYNTGKKPKTSIEVLLEAVIAEAEKE